MTAALDDDGVFVRSLASPRLPRRPFAGRRPHHRRARRRPGFDIVLLETVGTGQSEIDVAEVADIRVVISAPGLGDDIQAMKSGLLEIADVIVVNKGDRPGAEQTMQQLVGRAVDPRHGGRQGPGAQDERHQRRRRAEADRRR